MKPSLRFKLTTSFLLVTLIAFSIIGISANVILEKQFKEYVIDNINQKNDEIADTLKSRYIYWGDTWDVSGIENLGVSKLSDGLMIRVSDENGNVIWDAMTHNSGVCAEMLKNMADNMKDQNASFNGGYTEKEYQLTIDNSNIGSVAIGYYGPYFYTDNDISFLKTLNKLLLLATALAGILSLILGTYMAKRLSSPISKVIKTAEEIADGRYNSRASDFSNTLEMDELTNTINKLAETLGKQETLRKRLTADVAHELRTPIANLQSHLEAFIDGIWKPNTERLKSCHEETIRLTKIVSDLETLARYDGEKVEIKKEQFDLSEMINSILLSFDNEFINKNITHSTALHIQYLNADRDKISQIMVNLISNALKYTPEGGKIEILTSGNENEVQIKIKDNGIGISKEDLPYIFERFYRADKSRSRATGGSGIGLAIVKSLVDAHGGKILVHSEPGTGSEFIIVFPKV